MYHSYTTIDPEHPLVHCKACRGVLFIMKDIDCKKNGSIAFQSRCPHCQKDWYTKVTFGDTHIVELTDQEKN
ncbi:MAG: hypothetical protein HOE53_03730 [Candidatus Magasanikbacteria bacterium]|jgi:hypothetical protein|nr:hypothetical protein [Candidatus Magasanikbacteria bacterium]